MADRFTDLARIVLEDGLELKHWSEYSINSDFLTPTDGWSFSFGNVVVPADVRERVKPDRKVQIYIGDALQLTGWVDSVEISSDSSSGLRFNVQGRDVLKPLCKSHVHPDTRFKDRTVVQLIEAVLRYHYTTPPDVFYDNAANIKLVTGGKGGTVTQKTIDAAREQAASLSKQAAAASKSPAKPTFSVLSDATQRAQSNIQKLEDQKKAVSAAVKKTIDYVQPHPNEGAFEFIARNLRRFGLWIWATAEGSIVVGKPTYDQPPMFYIQRQAGDKIALVQRASYRHDRTDIPSQIGVRGKSHAQGFEKATVKGYLADTGARNKDYFEPFYMQHDQATTAEGAGAFAAQELSHLKQHERVYECACAGHRDPRTGNLYAIDCVALVNDDYLDVHELMWICSRTFRRSASGGTSTDLKLLPLGTIIFSDADATDMARKHKKK